uniref:Uncharacterized protein n=1 Tax=Setaria viridis TaxID=4556 RepID=A0A4U6UPF2_SETVI|nr:hypothetical protein SEVIR_5G051601v2 [Setaria viridis]
MEATPPPWFVGVGSPIGASLVRPRQAPPRHVRCRGRLCTTATSALMGLPDPRGLRPWPLPRRRLPLPPDARLRRATLVCPGLPPRGAQLLRRPRPPRPRRLPPRAGHPLRRIRRPLHRQRPPQHLLQAPRFVSPLLRCDQRGWHGISNRTGERAEGVRRNAREGRGVLEHFGDGLCRGREAPGSAGFGQEAEQAGDRESQASQRERLSPWNFFPKNSAYLRA